MAASACAPSKWIPVLFCVVVMHIACVMAQTVDVPLNMTSWGSQWSSTTSGCAERAIVNGSCAELYAGMQYVGPDAADSKQGGGYMIWAPPKVATQHGVCTPAGQEMDGRPGDGNCARAAFRFYCTQPGYVRFNVETRSYNRTGNDDSFWTWTDDGDNSFYLSGASLTTWRIRNIWGGARHFDAGPHSLIFAEREDGTMLRKITMTSGYPSCFWGAPLPGWNISAYTLSTVIDQIHEAQEQTDLRLDQSIDALQNQTEDMIANLTAKIDALSMQVSTLLTGMQGLAASGSSSPGTAGEESVQATGSNDIVLQGRGSIKVSGASCSDVDICQLRNSLQGVLDSATQASLP